METSIKSITLFVSIFLTGLSAGLFYAWAVSVIPGTLKSADMTYLETMQSINKEILNPWFYAIFFGALISLMISTLIHFQVTHKIIFWTLLAATVCYIGTFGVTAFGNVPLNDELEALDLLTLTEEKTKTFRKYYEVKWNRLHLIRTIFSVIAFLLSLLPILMQRDGSYH